MLSIFRGLPAVPQFFLVLCVASLLAAQQQEAPAPNTRPAIKANVNEVLVPVVVRDGQGNAVGNLEKENFQVLDNGKPQVITGFTIIERATEPTGAIASSSAPGSSPNTAQPASPAQRFVVFLFDDLNLGSSDLPLAQKAATQLLEASLPHWPRKPKNIGSSPIFFRMYSHATRLTPGPRPVYTDFLRWEHLFSLRTSCHSTRRSTGRSSGICD